MNTFTLKVVEVRKETDDTVTLCFKQPGLKKIKYLAGQYITLIVRINGRRYIRPYSFSSCFGIDDFLEITVKRVLNGIVSNHINDRVKEGDMIEVMPPMGDFVFTNTGGELQSVYLWGIGSGITPLMSIAKQVLATEPDLKVNLLYGNRNHEKTIFIDKIHELLNKNPDRFSVTHFHTELKVYAAAPNIIQGRIDDKKALEILKADNAILQSVHYICGPVGLKESVKKALLSVNVSESAIFSEEFELVKDPKDFVDIETRNVVLNFENKEVNLEVVKGKSILEAALDADIELPYSCQTGNCSTCKGKVITGQTKMIGIKEREDLLQDEYLLCCTYPLNDNVYIEL